MSKFKNMDKILLLSGYVNYNGGGHAIVLYIEKKTVIEYGSKTNIYNLTLVNSGEGLKFHPDKNVVMQLDNLNERQFKLILTHHVFMKNFQKDTELYKDIINININSFYYILNQILNDKKEYGKFPIYDILGIIEVIDERRCYVKWNCKIKPMVQDNGRTLKILVEDIKNEIR